MKKLLLLSLLPLFLFSCSNEEEEKKYSWEVYIENTDNIACLKKNINKEYPSFTDEELDKILYSGKSADHCMYGENDKLISKEESILSYVSSKFCDLTESEIIVVTSTANRTMKDDYDNGKIGCLITYTYRKVEPN